MWACHKARKIAGIRKVITCLLYTSSAPDLRFKAAARAEVKVRVESGVVVVLHPVVLVTETRIDGQPRRYFIAVLSIPGPILVPVAASKGCLAKRSLDCAGGTVNDIAKVAVGGRGVHRARELALGVDARRERD